MGSKERTLKNLAEFFSQHAGTSETIPIEKKDLQAAKKPRLNKKQLFDMNMQELLELKKEQEKTVELIKQGKLKGDKATSKLRSLDESVGFARKALKSIDPNFKEGSVMQTIAEQESMQKKKTKPKKNEMTSPNTESELPEIENRPLSKDELKALGAL